MENKEHIFNIALEKLRAGETLEQVLSQFPQYSQELKPLLEITLSLFTLPKNEIPAPAMRRKYSLQPAPRLWLSWLGASRWATVSVGLVLIFTAIAGTSYAAITSLPGNKFFALKKSIENIQLSLAGSPTAKAQLQVVFAQQRLQEVEQILQNPQSNSQQETAAVNELVSTTNDTVNAVNAAAHSNSISGKDHPLVASLETITSQQQSLLKQAQDKTGVSQAADTALAATQQNVTQVAQIKQYLAIASSEQTLTQTVSDPNSVSISGYVTAIDKNSLTVEKTSFVVNANTVVEDAVGSSIGISNLNTTTKVTVLGSKDGKLIVAQQVSVVAPEINAAGAVKGASTSTPGTTSPTSVKKDPAPTPSPSASTTTDPNIATGSFILENPAPQANP